MTPPPAQLHQPRVRPVPLCPRAHRRHPVPAAAPTRSPHRRLEKRPLTPRRSPFPHRCSGLYSLSSRVPSLCVFFPLCHACNAYRSPSPSVSLSFSLSACRWVGRSEHTPSSSLAPVRAGSRRSQLRLHHAAQVVRREERPRRVAVPHPVPPARQRRRGRLRARWHGRADVSGRAG